MALRRTSRHAGHFLAFTLWLACLSSATMAADTGGVSVTVPGTANPWLALGGSTDDGGDAIPAESPVAVPGLTLTPGANLTFNVAGSVSYSGDAPSDPPDGSPGYFYNHPAENDLSGVTAVVDGLVGVFVDDHVVDPANPQAPAALDFSDPASVPGGVDFASLRPVLGQVFFIGDGLDASGNAQQFTVPENATHLILGTMDGSGWYNNTGAFTVTVNAAGAVGVPLTPVTLSVNGSMDRSTVAQGAPITFTATEGAVGAGVYVRVQATMTPAVEQSWTDLNDATNGGAGFLKGDGSGNYTLTTTQYPFGQGIYFRAIAAAPGQTDQISNDVGGFNLESADAPNLRINETASTADAPNASVAIVGDEITYTFVVRNDGPQTATHVRVIDALPSFLHLESADNGYTVDNNNVVAWTFPTLSPTTNGAPLTLKLVVSVTSDAFVGQAFSNRGFAVTADLGADVQGADIITTTVIQPLEVVVTSNGATATPGRPLTFKIDVHNRTTGKVKDVGLRLPIPGVVNYVPAGSGFVDDEGNAIAAPAPKSGKPAPKIDGVSLTSNPMINGTNLLAYFGDLGPNARAHLVLNATVPFDVDPSLAITFDGAQVTTKTPVGGANSFTLPDTTVTLSGSPAASAPQITFQKLVLDEASILQLGLSQPKFAASLKKALAAIAKDPAELAAFATVYPGLAGLNPATATISTLSAAFNPDIGYEASDVAGQAAMTTVNAPSSKKAETYIAFVLPYANTGGSSAAGVVVTDRVPAGTSILDASGNYNASALLNAKPASPANGKLDISGDGRTLTFHVGNVNPNTSGFILYKVRLLTAGEAGAPSPDSILTTSGSTLSTPSLSHTSIGQPDGQDIQVIGKYGYYYESTSLTGNSTTLSQGVTYDIYYKNTGGRASKILEIDDPIPAGLQYLGCELLDENRKSYAIPADAVEAPAAPAGQPYPTSGTVIFHPPLFKGTGTVARKDSGYIREYFYPTPTALADGHPVFVHAPFIAASSGAAASSQRGGRRRTLAGDAEDNVRTNG